MLGDFELIEVNEAFAAQYIGVERELGLDREITNVNGSGIGLGHPVGSTGCRIMVTLLYAMKRKGKSLGLATLCGGGGVSMACRIGNDVVLRLNVREGSLANGVNVEAHLKQGLVIQNVAAVEDEGGPHHAFQDPEVIQVPVFGPLGKNGNGVDPLRSLVRIRFKNKVALHAF